MIRTINNEKGGALHLGDERWNDVIRHSDEKISIPLAPVDSSASDLAPGKNQLTVIRSAFS